MSHPVKHGSPVSVIGPVSRVDILEEFISLLLHLFTHVLKWIIHDVCLINIVLITDASLFLTSLTDDQSWCCCSDRMFPNDDYDPLNIGTPQCSLVREAPCLALIGQSVTHVSFGNYVTSHSNIWQSYKNNSKISWKYSFPLQIKN